MLTPNNHNIIGTWKLKSFTITKSDNTCKPWGKSIHGLLTYNSDGYMFVSINREKNTDNNAIDSVLSYAGTYKIVDDKTIVHHVETASDPNRIGKDMVRTATLASNNLTLVAKDKYGIAKLIWEKLK